MIGTICLARSVLTEVLYIVRKEEFSVSCYRCAKCTLDERPSIFIKVKMLHKDYDSKGSVARKNNSGCEPQEA
jgi:hypothetical protein